MQKLKNNTYYIWQIFISGETPSTRQDQKNERKKNRNSSTNNTNNKSFVAPDSTKWDEIEIGANSSTKSAPQNTLKEQPGPTNYAKREIQ